MPGRKQKERQGERLRRRQTDELEERRSEILKAATRVFAAKGFRRADVREIADKAGVGKGTVYRHFGTKKQLFLAAVDRGMGELTETILSRIAPFPDPIKKIEVGVKEYFSFFDKNKDLVEIFIQERSEFRGKSKATYFTYRDNNINELEENLREGIKKGIFRKVNVKRAAEALTDLMYGTVISHLMRGERSRLVSHTKNVLDIYFNGIRKAAGAGTVRRERK